MPEPLVVSLVVENDLKGMEFVLMVEEMTRNGGNFVSNMKHDQDDAYLRDVERFLSSIIETDQCRCLLLIITADHVYVTRTRGIALNGRNLG